MRSRETTPPAVMAGLVTIHALGPQDQALAVRFCCNRLRGGSLLARVENLPPVEGRSRVGGRVKPGHDAGVWSESMPGLGGPHP